MARRREKHLYLPQGMRLARGKFYFDQPLPIDEKAKTDALKAGGKYRRKYKFVPLGEDYVAALTEYGRLVRPNWVGRTLRDVFTRYKTEITPLALKGRPRTEEAIDNELRTIDRFDRVFGGMQQDALTQQQLYLYIDRRLDERAEFKDLKKPAPSAARHDVRFLKKVLAKGIRWGAGTTNAAVNLEMDPDPANTRDVTDEQYAAVYRLANIRVQIAMDLADNIGQRRGDILGIRPARDFTPEGILVRQGKTGKPILIEWTDELRATVDRALALPPDIPKEYLIRNRVGKGYTPRGFGAMWQKLMRKVTRPGKNGEPPILAERFKFRDLRRKSATDKAIATSEEEAQQLLAHSDLKTTQKHYIAPRGVKPKRVKPVR